ncbi:MAG TPA: hypothetical protein VE133_18870 [Candidatus Sulfotelmatobacter sp.]|nr:hypothetical protein [Candidatus Sulfotelmatobacter sp.]
MCRIRSIQRPGQQVSLVRLELPEPQGLRELQEQRGPTVRQPQQASPAFQVALELQAPPLARAHLVALEAPALPYLPNRWA